MNDLTDNDKSHEECGVVGIYAPAGNNVSREIYYGLLALQHRGQESAGISVSDTAGPKGNIETVKGMGLVAGVPDSGLVDEASASEERGAREKNSPDR